MAGKGWTWTWQRCGRYKYQKVLVHTTNPHHLVPSTPSLTESHRLAGSASEAAAATSSAAQPRRDPSGAGEAHRA
jgi:hypothetical protein